jgi:hypothetical protein
MKLRLKGNSMRLRLTRSEVAQLQGHGLVEESVHFGGGEVLTYRLQSSATVRVAQVEFSNETIGVTLPAEAVQAWASSDDAGIYAQSGPVTIAIEKDFRCLTRSDEEQERDAFPHPAQQACTER